MWKLKTWFKSQCVPVVLTTAAFLREPEAGPLPLASLRGDERWSRRGTVFPQNLQLTAPKGPETGGQRDVRLVLTSLGKDAAAEKIHLVFFLPFNKPGCFRAGHGSIKMGYRIHKLNFRCNRIFR